MEASIKIDFMNNDFPHKSIKSLYRFLPPSAMANENWFEQMGKSNRSPMWVSDLAWVLIKKLVFFSYC